MIMGIKLTIFVQFCIATYVAANDCSISLSDFLVEPVVLTSSDKGNSYALFKPSGAVTSIEDGTKVLLVCAGKKNHFEVSGLDELELTCTKGDFKDTNGKTHTIKNSQCKAIPTSELRETTTKCAGGKGLVYEAGFTYHKDQFAAVFVICYDKPTQTVFYTHNVINGAAIEHSISESTRRGFRADGLGKTTTAVNRLYTIANQIKRFEKEFGKNQKYVTKSHFFARGHLAPDADGIDRPAQLSTYFYCNVKPEFQQINAGNWLRAESMSRKKAGQMGSDLDAYTGVFGNLEWADSKGNLKKVFLDDEEKFEVPESYFKVLKDAKTNSGIVIISLNNPYEANPESKQVCKNICASANWDHADFTNVEKGFTYCCSVAEFSKYYKDLPKEAQAKNVLKME